MQRDVDIPPHLTYVATLPCETRMTEKPTKFTVFQKTPTNHNILLSNISTNVSVACLLCNTTTSPDLFKQMCEMSPFGFHISKKTLSPVEYGCVDDAHGRQLPRLQQCVHAVRRCC